MTPTRLTREEAERLVAAWDGLAWQLAHRYHRRTCGRGDVADYHAAAVLGLWEAALRFDPARGFEFSTYAQRWAKKRVLMFARVEAAAGLHVPAYRGVVWVEPAALDGMSRACRRRVEPASGRPPERVERAAFWRAVDAALPTDRHRLVVWLYYRCGWQDRDIAAVIGVTPGGAGEFRRTALARLRRHAAALAEVA